MTDPDIVRTAYEDRVRTLVGVYLTDPTPEALKRFRDGLLLAQEARDILIKFLTQP